MLLIVVAETLRDSGYEVLEAGVARWRSLLTDIRRQSAADRHQDTG